MPEENPDDLMGEMKIEVTVREFHRIHDVAGEAEKRVRQGGLNQLSASMLLDLLGKLEAGQRLTDAENGIDRM